MTIAFFTAILNNHQACLADEIYNLIGKNFIFVELENLSGENKKGSTEDYSTRPYLLQSWKDVNTADKAMEIALTYDVCIFDGGFNYQKVRMETGKLTFEFSERWLKKGWINILSPRLIENILTYHFRQWSRKPLYKLCASAYAAHDQHLLGTFKNKCFKFGYFTSTDELEIQEIESQNHEPSTMNHLMWCARFIDWKHPEMAIECVRRLKAKGYPVTLDMYGDGPLREGLELRAEGLGIGDPVTFHGNVPNEEIQKAMRESDIFLFTSDKQEGWGAVANEAMSNGCCLVASNEIGAVPYLVKDGVNGVIFKSRDIDDLTQKVLWLINNPQKRMEMQQKAYETMRDTWSPRHAAESLLQLIDDLQQGRETNIKEGPCSKA